MIEITDEEIAAAARGEFPNANGKTDRDLFTMGAKWARDAGAKPTRNAIYEALWHHHSNGVKAQTQAVIDLLRENSAERTEEEQSHEEWLEMHR